MIGSSHLVAIGRFEPAKSGDGESEHIQISIIVSMLQIKGTVRRATQDETVVPRVSQVCLLRSRNRHSYISKVSCTDVPPTEQKNCRGGGIVPVAV